jgi:LysM repeat protein
MKTLPAAFARFAAHALVLGLVPAFEAAAQPASGLPSGYTYMQPPPPGYPSAPPPAGTSKKPSASSSTRGSTTRSSGYGPLPDSLSLQVAQLAANDQQQDSRIRKLEKDVSSIKTGGVRLTSSGTDTASASLRPHTSHVVRPGDSLWRIASTHRVAPGEIMALNRMKSDVVLVGQTLMIPAPRGSSAPATTQAAFKPYYHDVRPGDTSSTIAKKYGISRNALMAANPRVDFGGGLVPGSRIVIPGKTGSASSPRVTPSSSSSTGGAYVVKPGDSLKAIAIKHGTTTANLAALNGIKDPNKLFAGQRLVLPGGKSSSGSRSVAASAPAAPKTTPPPAASSDTVPLPGYGLGTTAAAPAPAPAAKPPAPPPATPKPAASAERGVLAYRVDATDSIESIAHQFSTTPERIREMNHLPPDRKLKADDEIMVPAMGAVAVGN